LEKSTHAGNAEMNLSLLKEVTAILSVVENQWKTNNTEAMKMVQLGKRYKCEHCGTEILCTKAGEGQPACCDKEMQVIEPKPLPSSD
jgi:rubrerythrin